MFVCNYDRKKFVDDYRQKYVEITKKCLWIEIADKRLRFLQTKHLQCGGAKQCPRSKHFLVYLHKLQKYTKLNIFQNKNLHFTELTFSRELNYEPTKVLLSLSLVPFWLSRVTPASHHK